MSKIIGDVAPKKLVHAHERLWQKCNKLAECDEDMSKHFTRPDKLRNDRVQWAECGCASLIAPHIAIRLAQPTTLTEGERCSPASLERCASNIRARVKVSRRHEVTGDKGLVSTRRGRYARKLTLNESGTGPKRASPVTFDVGLWAMAEPSWIVCE